MRESPQCHLNYLNGLFLRQRVKLNCEIKVKLTVKLIVKLIIVNLII